MPKAPQPAISEENRRAFQTEAFVPVLGVPILNLHKQRAVTLLEEVLQRREPCPQSVFFVNAHTLNLACADPSYRGVLNSGDFVFGDGTGVRWGARLQGVRMRDNLMGTDFVPYLFTTTADRGYSYFLLGSDETTIAKAAGYALANFPGWRQAGYHHGFLKNPEVNTAAIDLINSVRPDILLVGMGNPIQERWIQSQRGRLNTSLCLGIGGLFDFWAGNFSRAPAWLRKIGHEWAWRLLMQPCDKARRYLIGNPLFLSRLLIERFQRKRR